MATTKFPLVETVDFSQMAHSDPKKTQGGAGIAIVYSRKSQSDRGDVTFQLGKPAPELLCDETPRKDREEALRRLPFIRSGFHLQADPKFEVRDGKHTLLLGISEEQAAQVRRLDEANIAEVVKNAQPWFKRSNLPVELVRAQYSAVVYRYPQTDEVAENDKTTVLRTKIVEGKTEILVQNPDNYRKFHHGDMKDLRMNARVVPVLKDNGIYFRSTESGGQVFVKRFLVMHGEWDASDAAFDTGDIDIEIEEDFVPPQSAPSAKAAGKTLAAPAGSVTEQTVVNGPQSWSMADHGDSGAAVVF